MRNLLLAPVLASFALTSFTAPADACGPYVQEPKIFKLTTHHVESHTRLSQSGKQSASTTFALIGSIDAEQAKQLPWQRLAPHSYDYSAMAPASDLATPMTVTLIGPTGTTVVSSKRRAFLEHTFVESKPSTALELAVPKGEFTFALAGRHEDAKWIALGDQKIALKSDLAWVAKQGVTPIDPQYVHVAKLAGTNLETVSVLAGNGAGMITLVRSGKDLYTRFDGMPVGALTFEGQRFVLMQLEGVVTAQWL